MRALVISPHPDDETLGCGGTLLKHRSQGDELSWLIVTAVDDRWPSEFGERREIEIEQVSAAYGFEETFRLGLPSGRLDTIPLEDLVHRIGEVVEKAKPECLYMVHSNDVHSDHRIVFEATMSALKPFNTGKHGVQKVLSYETLSSTDATLAGFGKAFLPNTYCDIGPFIERKLEIMAMYPGEVQKNPLPRSLESIRSLARLRGSTIGVEYAEAFMLLRQIC